MGSWRQWVKPNLTYPKKAPNGKALAGGTLSALKWTEWTHLTYPKQAPSGENVFKKYLQDCIVP